MSKNEYAFDWGNLAFSKTGKKAVNDLKATFIAAPRQISQSRFAQLIRQYLPQGPIILGLAKEKYIAGFEGQPQFRTTQAEDLQEVITKVNGSSTPYRIYILSYFQRETKYVFSSLRFRKVLLLNGSWQYVFHVTEPFYTLLKKGVPYELASPFASENEARAYEAALQPIIKEKALAKPLDTGAHTPLTEHQMLHIAGQAAKLSYDYSYQTGVALGKPDGIKYQFLAYAFNKVVPFQTYAMHYGASRETNFSPPNDLNHYDTVHAEVMMLLQAQRDRTDLHGTTLFINLLPCPPCSRMLAESDIEEFVYSADHSDGYAVQLLEKAGKRVRRIVSVIPEPSTSIQ